MTKSTITRERLEKIKSWRETYGAGSNVMLPAEEAEELARIALAAMDSEPVAWDYEWASYITCEGPQDFKRIIEREAPPEWAIEEGQARNIIPLYRHAQQPVVPEDIPDSVYEILCQACGGKAWMYEEALWNACRAAMLAASPHDTPALNSLQSVDSVAGKWIPVSERMPDDAQEVIVQTHSGWRYIAFFEAHSGLFYDSPEGDVEYVLVTHWMPLPAAPQEVKGES